MKCLPFIIKRSLIVCSIFILTIMIFFPQDTSAAKKYKVLHIMSYHAPWEWTDDQLNGFKEALKGMNIEYKVYQMDTKRKNSKEWIEKVTRESKELIKSWEPDLVYTNDDNAQKYVVKDFVNTSTPFVFSGVNAEPKVYGFEGSKNVTGILERPHWLETIKLLKQMVPGIKKIGV
ncbi:MAG: ABC transporter substrate binding protein, partial [Chitinispirillia bacterium]